MSNVLSIVTSRDDASRIGRAERTLGFLVLGVIAVAVALL